MEDILYFIIFKTTVTSISPFLRYSRVYSSFLALSLAYGSNYHCFFSSTLLALYTITAQQRSSGNNIGVLPLWGRWELLKVCSCQILSQFSSGSDEVSYGRAAPVGTSTEPWEQGEDFLPSELEVLAWKAYQSLLQEVLDVLLSSGFDIFLYCFFKKILEWIKINNTSSVDLNCIPWTSNATVSSFSSYDHKSWSIWLSCLKTDQMEQNGDHDFVHGIIYMNILESIWLFDHKMSYSEYFC